MRQVLRDAVSRYVPRANGRLLAASACMFVNTPDQDLLIDWAPNQQQNVLLVSACSGHGFKMASSIGEALARMLTSNDCAAPLELQPFALRPERPGVEAVLRAFGAGNR
jgi:sarcosine oxidase